MGSEFEEYPGITQQEIRNALDFCGGPADYKVSPRG